VMSAGQDNALLLAAGKLRGKNSAKRVMSTSAQSPSPLAPGRFLATPRILSEKAPLSSVEWWNSE